MYAIRSYYARMQRFRFGGEPLLEYPGHDLLVDPRPLVGNGDMAESFPDGGAHGQRSPFPCHRLRPVEKHREKSQRVIPAVSPHPPRPFRGGHHKGDVAATQVVPREQNEFRKNDGKGKRLDDRRVGPYVV